MARFQAGQSGNPSGRKKGTQTRATRLRQILDKDADELVLKAATLAKAGDTTALRLCLERILPAMKAEARTIPLHTLAAAGTLADQGRAIIAEVGAGNIGADQAATLLQAVATLARIVEVDELTRRIEKLEGAVK